MHLCVDMQRIFASDGPWATPWMDRVVPVASEIASRFPERTIFTRFITPTRAEDMPGMWRSYYERWRQTTREHLDPRLLELVEPLGSLVPPATVIAKTRYSAFLGSHLLCNCAIAKPTPWS
jgi:nicotinamidase-related amidase